MALYGNSILNPRVHIGMSAVLEKYDWLKDTDYVSSLSEASFNVRLDTSVKEFTRDAEQYLLDVKTSKDEKESLAQGLALASLGFYIVGALTKAVFPVTGIIILLTAIVIASISLVKSMQVNNDIKKIKDLKFQAIRCKSKIKDKKDADRMQQLIEMIDHEIDGFYKDQPKQNVNYNYNM